MHPERRANHNLKWNPRSGRCAAREMGPLGVSVDEVGTDIGAGVGEEDVGDEGDGGGGALDVQHHAPLHELQRAVMLVEQRSMHLHLNSFHFMVKDDR